MYYYYTSYNGYMTILAGVIFITLFTLVYWAFKDLKSLQEFLWAIFFLMLAGVIKLVIFIYETIEKLIDKRKNKDKKESLKWKDLH